MNIPWMMMPQAIAPLLILGCMLRISLNNIISSPSLPGFFDLCVPIKGLIIGHLNIRSIKAGNKLKELKLLLLQKPTVHILWLSETWLNECRSDKMFAIDDYSLVRRDRSSGGQGGETAIYVHSSITYHVRNDLITDPALECICVELKLPFTAPVLILNVYRPPSSNAETDTSLATCIENVVARNKECYVLGDLNVNTLCVRSCSNRLLKSIHSLGLSQMVDKPTRVDVNSSTNEPVTATSLIDHIYVSHVHNIVKVHVSDVTLSDHYPIFVIRRCSTGLPKRKYAHTCTTINYRSLKSFDQKKFKEDLAQAPWSIIESFDNPLDALDTWYNIYNSIVDLHVPRRVKHVKSLMLPKWISLF